MTAQKTVRIGRDEVDLGSDVTPRATQAGTTAYLINDPEWAGLRDVAVFHGDEVIGFLGKNSGTTAVCAPGTKIAVGRREMTGWVLFPASYRTRSAGHCDRLTDAVASLIAIHDRAAQQR